MSDSVTKFYENREEELERRMNIIGQNGNTGDHYLDSDPDVELPPNPNQLKLHFESDVSVGRLRVSYNEVAKNPTLIEVWKDLYKEAMEEKISNSASWEKIKKLFTTIETLEERYSQLKTLK